MTKQRLWHCNAYRLTAIGALALVLGFAPRAARAACVGDCNGDGEVTVNELITMVNIALETAQISSCPAGDANGDGVITVNEIVAGVNNALTTCPPPTEGVCGDGVKNEAQQEECDDGGTCLGGTNAGTHCDAEADCQGEGVCVEGTSAAKACSADSDCPGGKCRHCVPQGGDGCAANCTTESDVVMTLKPGEVDGTDIKPGGSGAVVHGDILTIPLPLQGQQTLTIGKARNGKIPGIIKADSVKLPRIAVSTLACACVRGVGVKTCGGTLFEADGSQSPNCTDGFPGATTCTTKPCTFMFGEGNTTAGVIGCEGLDGNDYTVTQDNLTGLLCNGGPNAGQLCATDADCPDSTCNPPAPVIGTLSGHGGAGSAVVLNANAIGTVVGLCQGTLPDYGPDGEFCTDDDPLTNRGTPSVSPIVTGTATGTLTNANNSEGNHIGPFSASGAPLSCSALASGSASGGALAGAFTALAQPTLGDIVVTNVLIAQ